MSERPRRWWHRLFGRRAEDERVEETPDAQGPIDHNTGEASETADAGPEPAEAAAESASPSPDPLTADVGIRCEVEKDRHEDFDEWMAPLVATSVDSPGFVGASLDCSRSEEFAWRLEFRFCDQESRQQFLDSDAYKRAFEWVPDIFSARPQAELR
ncbi:MAG: antibiotic biosynthesis monooxygenase [Actinobacteria bacterium]|nr:antibiotic biosynthesis monooxygenase [Actinomycetota bacterium]